MYKYIALLLLIPLFFAIFLIRMDFADTLNKDMINETQAILDPLINLTPTMQAKADSIAASYYNPFENYYDILGAALVFVIIALGCWSAFKDATIGHYTFFSYIFFGTLFILFATAIFAQISDYFYYELLPALAIGGLDNYPIMSWYYSQMFWVNMTASIIMVSLRKFEIFSFTSGGGAKEE